MTLRHTYPVVLLSLTITLWTTVSTCAADPVLATEGLVAFWPLTTDGRDHGPGQRHLTMHGEITRLPGALVADQGAGRWNGIDTWYSLPSDQLDGFDQGDFSVSTWVFAEEGTDDLPGDLLARYDLQTARGWHLSLKTSAVTTCVANERHLQFGIDDARQSAWTDCGRPGEALIAFGLAVHNNELFAATCEPGEGQAGHVYRYAADGAWIDCGSPDRSNAVIALAVYQGALYAGTGKYRIAGSSLPESTNTTSGGQVYRYDGGTSWTLCGRLPNTEAIGGFIVFRGKLYASSLYRPAGFYRYDGDQQWTDAGTPDGKRVVALAVHNGFLYGSSYDSGRVYQYDGAHWRDLGVLGDNTQTYSFCVYDQHLYVGTWPSGRVYRYVGPNDWADAGRLGAELEVMGLLVHNGRMLGGTLPLAEVYSYGGGQTWNRLLQLDTTPEVKYRRAWTMAEHQGKVFVSTLPSGKVHSVAFGQQVQHGVTLPANWQHVAAVRTGSTLRMYLNGRLIEEQTTPGSADWNLAHDTALTLGRGPHDTLRGSMSHVRLYRRALTTEEVQQLAVQRQ
jgi:hypothetical protein